MNDSGYICNINKTLLVNYLSLEVLIVGENHNNWSEPANSGRDWFVKCQDFFSNFDEILYEGLPATNSGLLSRSGYKNVLANPNTSGINFLENRFIPGLKTVMTNIDIRDVFYRFLVTTFYKKFVNKLPKSIKPHHFLYALSMQFIRKLCNQNTMVKSVWSTEECFPEDFCSEDLAYLVKLCCCVGIFYHQNRKCLIDEFASTMTNDEQVKSKLYNLDVEYNETAMFIKSVEVIFGHGSASLDHLFQMSNKAALECILAIDMISFVNLECDLFIYCSTMTFFMEFNIMTVLTKRQAELVNKKILIYMGSSHVRKLFVWTQSKCYISNQIVDRNRFIRLTAEYLKTSIDWLKPIRVRKERKAIFK